jgi:hypothetical protein
MAAPASRQRDGTYEVVSRFLDKSSTASGDLSLFELSRHWFGGDYEPGCRRNGAR